MADGDDKPTGVAAVKYLRDRTGQSIEECVRLLNAADGDVERAMAMRFDPGASLPPTYRCPKCGKGFGRKLPPSECPNCDWLRFPSERAAWGTAGPCRRCGFAFRWDGERCSHCGLNTRERPAIRLKVTMPLRRVPRPR
jgi:rubrerythrin